MKNCSKCGVSIENDNQRICHNCGNELAMQQSSNSQGNNMNGTANNTQSTGSMYNPVMFTMPKPMNWYKFLVYFGLWAGAFFNVFSGLTALTGTAYQAYNVSGNEVYEQFGSVLKSFDMIRGILFIGLAVYGIVTAVNLLKYKAVGPKLLTGLYALGAVVTVFSYVGEYMIVNSVVKIPFDASVIVPSIIMSVVMIVANNTYFQKRADLFIN